MIYIKFYNINHNLLNYNLYFNKLLYLFRIIIY